MHGLKSRRLLFNNRDTPLYVFPSFDLCDSLLFFPYSLSRHLNSGDIPAASKLIHAHLHKDCAIDKIKNCGFSVSPETLIRFYEIVQEVHPDSFGCVHNTIVEGNVVKSVMFVKSTHLRSLYYSVAYHLADAHFAPAFQFTWEEMMERKCIQGHEPEEEKKRLHALIHSGFDLVVFMRIEAEIVIDEASNKIISMSFHNTTTDLQPVGKCNTMFATAAAMQA